MRFKGVATLLVVATVLAGLPVLAADQSPSKEGATLGEVIEWVKGVFGFDDGDENCEEIGGYIDPNG